MELAELDERPGGRLGEAGGVQRELHRRDGGARPAAQLPGVRDAGVAGERGLDRDHAVEGPERLVVAAELEERVADEAVAARRVRRGGDRPPCEPQGLAKLMAARRERREAGESDRIARVAGESAAQSALGEGVIGDVARLARPLQVREAEEAERAAILRARPAPPPRAGARSRRCLRARSRRERDLPPPHRRAARRHARHAGSASRRTPPSRTTRAAVRSAARRRRSRVRIMAVQMSSGRAAPVGGPARARRVPYGPPMGLRWTCSCA